MQHLHRHTLENRRGARVAYHYDAVAVYAAEKRKCRKQSKQVPAWKTHCKVNECRKSQLRAHWESYNSPFQSQGKKRGSESNSFYERKGGVQEAYAKAYRVINRGKGFGLGDSY